MNEIAQLIRDTIREELRKPPPQLLSKRAAARLLGVSRGRTLDVLIKEGRVRTVQVNGRLRIPMAEITRIQDEGTDLAAPKR